ncbi:BED-type domain-containing protein [Citrus sinensis]|uniref:BED-type domain-containing protein n=1 Tax=Citrus sinensis TaxID=2711 RepID=A0ACB8I1S2_CITSI|nr:BED-type domain-containing protein [Citrus sinensis]
MADIKGISPSLGMHKILLEDCYSNSVEQQRRLNPIMKEMVKKEIINCLDAEIIYPISDSSWVSPIQCVPKKGGIRVITNEKDELIPTRTVAEWRVYMDYKKLNKATRKDHFHLSFIDQMLDRLNRTIDGLQNELRVESKLQFTSPISFKLEKMLGQLASSVQTLAMTVEKGKFPIQPVPNLKGVHEASTSSPQQHGEVKAVMTLRKGKEVDNKVEMPVTKENQIIPVNVEDSPPEEKEETNPREYVPKAPFLQRLAKGKKGKSTGEILEIFKQPSSVVLQLADRSTKIPLGIVEDVLIQVDKFYFPVDFIVIDTQPIQDSRKHIPIILGQPFLATADAHIQCRTGNVQLSFGNMSMELNIFNIAKQPHNADDEIVDVDLIEALVDDTFLSNLSDDPLQTCLTHFGLDFDIDRSVDEMNALLDSAPSMDTNKWKSRVEQLALSEKKLIPSSESSPKLELKPLPNTLEYAFLGEESILPGLAISWLNVQNPALSLVGSVTRGLSLGPLHHGQRWRISSSVVTPSVPHGFKRLVARCLDPSRSPSKAQSPQSLTLTVFKRGDAVKALVPSRSRSRLKLCLNLWRCLWNWRCWLLAAWQFEIVKSKEYIALCICENVCEIGCWQSGGVVCEIVKSLKMFADDFEHEVEVNDNENDSATIVTGGNKRKKSSSSKPPLPRKKMAPRSTVWQHFTRVPNDHTKCKCNYCGQEFECGTVGYETSTLRTHNRERCQKFKDLQKNQTILTQDVGSDEVVARGFSQEACRRATVKMIVLDELPFSVVENPGFRNFCSVAAPRYLLPSRRTISRDTLEMYLEEKAKLKSLLAGNKQRVSLTTDIWTSITTTSYMVITAHFIDRDWNLHRKIISFNTVNDHSSETIGKQLEKCLIDWGIERVFTVTVDNASPNEGALRYLIDRVKTWRDDGLVLNGDYLHVCCCAHILNLIVTEGLKELEQSIVSVRNAVKYVRSSTARMQAFQIRVQQEKIKCRGSVILDCPTRWNSTYSMLNTALKFKPAFDRMALEDKLYDAYFNENEGGKKKREGPPLYSDWENTNRVEVGVQVEVQAEAQAGAKI